MTEGDRVITGQLTRKTMSLLYASLVLLFFLTGFPSSTLALF